jgi:hypothetical protein
MGRRIHCRERKCGKCSIDQFQFVTTAGDEEKWAIDCSSGERMAPAERSHGGDIVEDDNDMQGSVAVSLFGEHSD